MEGKMLFTPRAESKSPVRLRLDIEREGYLNGRHSERYIVKTIDGHRFNIKRANCGLGCRCDAVIVGYKAD